MMTGQITIQPQYKHAWIFSDGLAAVDIDGWIKFIDGTGKVSIDPHIPYNSERDGYVFHYGHCAVHNQKLDRLGLIDTKGNWKLAPEYFSITPADSMWVISNGKEHAVLDANLQEVIPFMEAELHVRKDNIEAIMEDHTIRTYDRQGVLLEAFHVSEVDQLLYNTKSVHYTTSKVYDEEDEKYREYEDSEPSFEQEAAACLKYEAACGWYGLMSRDGQVLTQPSYTYIEAIGPDLYLCKVDDVRGFIINGK